MAKKILNLCLILLLTSCSNSPKRDVIGKVDNATANVQPMYSQILLENKVELSLTSDFVKMNEGEVEIIFPQSGRRPDVVFRNKEGSANISMHHTKKSSLLSELPNVLEELTLQYKGNSRIEFIDSRIEKINGYEYVVLEFISPGENRTVYNVMLITSLDERVLMIAFTCAMPVIKEWKETGNRIIRTIKIL
jgi:hypothetical protein